jgi:hypothetical protein
LDHYTRFAGGVYFGVHRNLLLHVNVGMPRQLGFAQVACNQYSHTRRQLRLRQALSKAYSPYFGRALDPENVCSLMVTDFRKCGYCLERMKVFEISRISENI